MVKPVCVNTDEEEYTSDPKYHDSSQTTFWLFSAAADGVGVAFVRAPAWQHIGSRRCLQTAKKPLFTC